jgi:hypothetical protein
MTAIKNHVVRIAVLLFAKGSIGHFKRATMFNAFFSLTKYESTRDL